MTCCEKHKDQIEQFEEKIKDLEVPDIAGDTLNFLKKYSELLSNITDSEISEEEKIRLNDEHLNKKRDYILNQIYILYNTLLKDFENNVQNQNGESHNNESHISIENVDQNDLDQNN
jgi:hypothetical protein